MRRWTVALVLLLIAVALGTTGSTTAAGSVDGNWLSFGRTPDNNRHSPLTQITQSNVSTLGRVYSLDLQKIDPDIRRGQQSYPLAINGVLYVTTNDNNVFAFDGPTGKVLWQYKPPNSGFFKNFGVAANRGLSYCDGRLFMTQLDMTIVALRPSDGHVVGKVAIGQFVPNASTNYGYSETSAPICANHRIVVGAAGSEYGIRGFVMAFTTGLEPAWSTPYWTIPPEQQLWRRQSRIVGGGAVWTPVTIDAKTNTVYFGTGGGTPNFFPQLRPGAEPPCELAGRRRSANGAAALVAAVGRKRPVELRCRPSRLSSTTRRSVAGPGTSFPSRRKRVSGSPTTPRRARRSTSA